MATEDFSSRYADLDAWPTGEAVEALWDGQMAAVAAVRPALPALAAAVDAAAEVLRIDGGDGRRPGRLVYVGAGTSGRVAVQDGAELPPTYDWPEDRLVFLMAGGERALLSSVEGAEDDAEDGRARIAGAEIGPSDVVIGVAASGTTRFTVAAVEEATRRGAVTVGIACNPRVPLLDAARHPVLADTGPEAIAGSTRMKAGTAQKVILNLLSTAVMIRLGRVYRGLMVDMRPANDKLRRRAAAMVGRVAGCSADAAAEALAAGDGDVKRACLIARGVTPDGATALLARHDGILRAAMAEVDEGRI